MTHSHVIAGSRTASVFSVARPKPMLLEWTMPLLMVCRKTHLTKKQTDCCDSPWYLWRAWGSRALRLKEDKAEEAWRWNWFKHDANDAEGCTEDLPGHPLRYKQEGFVQSIKSHEGKWTVHLALLGSDGNTSLNDSYARTKLQCASSCACVGSRSWRTSWKTSSKTRNCA